MISDTTCWRYPPPQCLPPSPLGYSYALVTDDGWSDRKRNPLPHLTARRTYVDLRPVSREVFVSISFYHSSSSSLVATAGVIRFTIEPQFVTKLVVRTLGRSSGFSESPCMDQKKRTAVPKRKSTECSEKEVFFLILSSLRVNQILVWPFFLAFRPFTYED